MDAMQRLAELLGACEPDDETPITWGAMRRQTQLAADENRGVRAIADAAGTSRTSPVKVGTIDLHLFDRADGISKVRVEITDDVLPVVGATVTGRVYEVVREAVER